MEPTKLGIIFEDSNGAHITKEAYAQWKYSRLALIIETLYGKTINTLSVIFERKLLIFDEDKDKTLGDLGIKNSSKIYVMTRSRGGYWSFEV